MTQQPTKAREEAKPPPPATLAATVREAREAREWHPAGLARRCGMDQAIVSRLENGVAATLSGVRILALARVLSATRAAGAPWEPADFAGWCALLLELDARGRARGGRLVA